MVQRSSDDYIVTGVCDCVHRLKEQKDAPARVAVIVSTKLVMFVTLS
jgi:hypothetical protein